MPVTAARRSFRRPRPWVVSLAALMVSAAVVVAPGGTTSRPRTGPILAVRLAASAPGHVVPGHSRSAPHPSGPAPRPSPIAAPALPPAPTPSTTIGGSETSTAGTPPGPAAGGPASPVVISGGEDPTSLVVSWPAGPAATGPATVDVSPANGASASTPVASVPVAAGARAVALPRLPAGPDDVAIVHLAGTPTGGTIGPSVPFAPTAARANGLPLPCQGAGYGLGRVAIDGYTGFQGSYCLPPAFTSGTGAFCADHGLDYPFGVPGYQWASAPEGETTPLVNQYGTAVPAGDAARLDWIYATWGSTTDPARAVAIGAVTHAVMGDYPGLSVGDLDPPRLTVTGGDPSAIVADIGAMWQASATAAGPYRLTVDLGAGNTTMGRSEPGTVTLVGAGGGAEAGVPVQIRAQGATVDQPAHAVTGPDGTVTFSFTPTATSVTVTVATADLAGPDVTAWTPVTAPVPVQRVLTRGSGAPVTGSATTHAVRPASLTITKASADPAWVPVRSGFTFTVAQPAGSGGAWQIVATARTGDNGSIAPVTGLAPGTYQVTETAHPPAFAGAGPWTVHLTAGQDGRLSVTDQVVRRRVVVVKRAAGSGGPPIGPGVRFTVSFDAKDGGSYSQPLGTWVTGSGGRTTAHDLVPGRYRLVEVTPPPGYSVTAPVTFTVAAVAAPRAPAPDASGSGASGSGRPGWTAKTSRPASPGPTPGPGPKEGPTQTVTVTDTRAPVGGGAAPTSPLAPTAESGPAATAPVASLGSLAFTGLDVTRLVIAAMAVLVTGGALVALARRRRARRA